MKPAPPVTRARTADQRWAPVVDEDAALFDREAGADHARLQPRSRHLSGGPTIEPSIAASSPISASRRTTELRTVAPARCAHGRADHGVLYDCALFDDGTALR